MEKYNEIWKEICFQINKNKNTSEREFQIIAESIFEKLGWKQYLNEIARPTIPFGAANYGIPDIVIQSNNIKHYVVELKKISMGISERNVAQLISYMRQMQLSFGVLIGNSISIYYDDHSTSKSIKVVEVQFDSDNKLGPVILQYLSKDGFSKEKFKEFCINQIEKQSAIKEQEKQIEFLCSEEGSKYIKDLLSTEYSEEVINSIEVTITNTNKIVQPNPIQRSNNNLRFNKDQKKTRLLQTMGVSWFVSYHYHNKKDSSHLKWKNANTLGPRISSYNNSMQYHEEYLHSILNKSDNRLNINQLDLTAEEIKYMIRELL